MEIATIPAKDLRHTRVAQEWIEEGRLEGEAHQLNIASKRRQGCNVEIYTDLDSGREASELEEVVIAVVGGERDQKQ